MSIPNSLSIPLPNLSPVVSLFSVSLFLFSKYVHLYHFFKSMCVSDIT